jgi:hypothetical protein
MIWLTLITLILVPLFVAELFQCFPWIAEKLLLFASTKLPASARRDQLAQWQGDIDALPGQLIKVIKATSILLGSPAIGRAIATGIRQARPSAPTTPAVPTDHSRTQHAIVTLDAALNDASLNIEVLRASLGERFMDSLTTIERMEMADRLAAFKREYLRGLEKRYEQP